MDFKLLHKEFHINTDEALTLPPNSVENAVLWGGRTLTTLAAVVVVSAVPFYAEAEKAKDSMIEIQGRADRAVVRQVERTSSGLLYGIGGLVVGGLVWNIGSGLRSTREERENEAGSAKA